MKIAAIMTCHDRKQKTLACLDSLFKFAPEVVVYLTDDGCSDGTPDEVYRRFPGVKIIKGDGNLFWSRGMFTAWSEAIKGEYDYYLWLNDDIELYPDFMKELFECNNIAHKQAVIVGLIKDIETGKILYGGTDANGKLVQESNNLQPIYNINGNVVLVPKCVVDKIGIIDSRYWHDIGDVDYGLMARKAGIPVLSTRKAVADGYSNGKLIRIRKWGTSIRERFGILYSPLGANPSIHFYFIRKHEGISHAIAMYLYLHVINILPDCIVKAIWGDKFVG